MTGTAIRAVLFDKDGTLFDFHATWAAMTEAMLDQLAPDLASRAAMARAAGFDPDARRFVPGSVIVAEPTSALARLWAGWRPDLGAAAIEAIANDVAAAAASDILVPAAPDLAGLLNSLRGRGLGLGIATHDEERSTRVQLAAAGLDGLFDFIAGYDSGHGLKPGPGMLRAFSAALGIPPGSVAVVGDSVHDLGMARAGGAALSLGVLSGPAGREDLAPYADHVLLSIAELPALLDAWSPADARKATRFCR